MAAADEGGAQFVRILDVNCYAVAERNPTREAIQPNSGSECHRFGRLPRDCTIFSQHRRLRANYYF